MNYYLCLISSEWRGEDCDRGDIVTPPAGTAPPAVAWASFTPPAGLRGTPQLLNVEDPETGDLTFRFSLKGRKENLVVRAKIGMPLAYASLEGGNRSQLGSPPEPPTRPKLEFGLGSGRSLVRWAPGGAKPAPPKPVEYDPLHYDSGRDPLGKDYLK